jgi:hypothetical protein
MREIEASSTYPSSYNRIGISSEDQAKDNWLGVGVFSASNIDAVGEMGSSRSSRKSSSGKSSMATMNR